MNNIIKENTMVDAIGSVSNKPFVKSKDTSINWKNCTADEIKEYKGQGQDVPVAILAWAEEIAKLSNAPDDVTYEMVNGSTSIEEINQVLAISDSANANDKDETDQNTNMSKAQSERSILEEGGTTLSDQGKIFMDKSSAAAGSTNAMAGVLQGTIDASLELADNADQIARQTESQTSALKNEYDALVARAKDQNADPLTEAEQARLAVLGGQLSQVGNAAQGALAAIGSQADALRANISGFNGVPEGAVDYGTETANIGLELMGVSDDKRASIADKATAAAGAKDGAQNVIKQNSKINFGRMMFDADYRLGVRASQQGANDVNVGNQGILERDSADAQVETNIARINIDKTAVENDTYVSAADTPNNANGDKAQQSETKDETVAKEKDITLADETITTDPNEIQKRKERKGLA